MHIFLDANVLFSAAKSDGAIRRLLGLLHKAGHVGWVDDYVIAEARRNLHAKGPEALAAFERLVRGLRVGDAKIQKNVARAEVAWLPEKDQPVLAAAIRLRCDALVTGDRTHFGAGYGKKFGGVVVYSPRSLAEHLRLG